MNCQTLFSGHDEGFGQCTNLFQCYRKNVIEKVEKMHNWLLKSGFQEIRKEDAVQKMFEFSKTIRNYVKEPSPTISLSEYITRKSMHVRGNLYNVSKSRTSLATLS